ncbi:glycoside hydrolase family 2 protein [Planctomycetota bacterium]
MKDVKSNLIVILLSLAAAVSAAQRQSTVLSEGWFLKQVDTQGLDIPSLSQEARQPGIEWLRTDMPRQVAEVLLNYGRIPDPHVSKNAAACAWIWEQDWAYAKTFVAPPGQGPVLLRLMGVDTVATVYVNGKEVGRCNNMFRRYVFDIRSSLKKDGDNVLLVVFTGPAKELARIKREVKLKYNIPANKYMRKATCDFTDYLGALPNFMKVGLFREVILDVPGSTWLEDTVIRPTLNDDLTQATVEVLLNTQGLGAPLRYSLTDADGETVARGAVSTNDPSFSFTVERPRLWWPYTHGEPHLYTLTLDVVDGDRLLDTQSFKVGLRSIERVSLDENTGEARFAFKINHRQIYLKGAGWAPLEGMTHVWDRQRSDRQIALGKQANINLFRMWAEGCMPPAHWYEACDEQGILVWQDFYFGYGIDPFHEPDYRQNAEVEIADMIERLGNHPSIFLWVGGNENLMGWEFARGYGSIPNRDFVEAVMPTLVNELDPTRPFHPSSPWGGPYSNYPLQGDWHDYRTLNFVPLSSVPLFNSEVCRVSPPSATSMRRFLSEEELWPTGFEFKLDEPGKIGWPPMWQYRSSARAWDKIGAIEKLCDPQSPEDLVRVLGTAHGDNWKQRIEQQRRGVSLGQPDGNRRCWGSMVWRLNDPWPIVYMSAIDYYLEPKIAYYSLQRAFSPVLLSFEQTDDRIAVWVCNDSSEPISGTLTLSKMDFNGKVKGELSRFVQVNAGESERALDATPLRTIAKNEEMLVAKLNGQIVCHFVNAERYLHLPKATLTAKLVDDAIEISTDVYAREVTLAFPALTGAVFSDNYFDLIPGQTRRISINHNPDGKSVRIHALNGDPVTVSLRQEGKGKSPWKSLFNGKDFTGWSIASRGLLEGDANGDPFGWFFEDNYFDLLPGETKIVRILGDHGEGRVTARAWYSPHAETVMWKQP